MKGLNLLLFQCFLPNCRRKHGQQCSIRSGNSSSNWRVAALATENMRIEAEEEIEKLKKFYQSSSFPTPPFWNKQEAASFVDENIDTILFDCDGVLYRNIDVCPGGPECIQALLDKGKRVLFVTNNGGMNRHELKEKIANVLGIDSLRIEQMVSTSYSCATYLRQNLQEGSRIHVIGSAGFCEELAQNGFILSGGPSEKSPSMNRQELQEYDFPDYPIDAVALGHDTEFTFRKLCVANNLLLRNPHALFVTTNVDSFDLVGPDIRHIPGNGCTVKALEYCSKRKAINMGKPSKTLADLIAKEHGIETSRSLFVGDRLDTDM